MRDLRDRAFNAFFPTRRGKRPWEHLSKDALWSRARAFGIRQVLHRYPGGIAPEDVDDENRLRLELVGKLLMRDWRRRGLLTPKCKRPPCGAKTRAGTPCKARVAFNPHRECMATRCKLHGGLSSGARSPAGMQKALEALKRGRATQARRRKERAPE